MGDVIGFSGLRALTVDLVDPIMAVLADIDGKVFVTGGAIGLDALAGAHLARSHPLALHYVIVPADTSRVDSWWSRGEYAARIVVRHMPLGSTYRDRNQYIVDLVQELHAFPEHPEADWRSLRSGTWQTVRMARRAGIECHEHVLRGPFR